MQGLVATWRWAGAHPRLVDAALAVGLFFIALTALAPHHGPHPGARPPDALTIALLVAACGALLLRRERPLGVWAFTVLAGAVAVLHSDGALGLALPACLALFTLGARGVLRTTVLAAVASGLLFSVARAVADGAWLDEHGDAPALSFLAVCAAAAAIGVAVRGQRAVLEAAEARALQAEQTRDEEAERRVTDERLRIARELHDVVAHHISVINVQAGVARHLMDRQPDAARTALGLVREASRTVLTEMSTVLGLLRTPEDDAPTEPAPGLDQVPALVERMRHAGLATTSRSAGRPGPLDALTDLTAYRVVQESLTNALKHGTGSTELLVRHEPGEVVIQVTNLLPEHPRDPAGGGHGLIGMTERVASVGGRLVVGPTDDGRFSVCAQIPRAAAR